MITIRVHEETDFTTPGRRVKRKRGQRAKRITCHAVYLGCVQPCDVLPVCRRSRQQ